MPRVIEIEIDKQSLAELTRSIVNIAKYLFILLFWFSRSKCLRKEIVHFPAQRAARAPGEHHEGDRAAAGQSVAHTFRQWGELVVCEELRGCAGIRECRTLPRKSAKVGRRHKILKGKLWLYQMIYFFLDLCATWISLGIGTTMLCKRWRRVSSRWRRTRAVRWMRLQRARYSTFSIDCTCPGSAYAC